MDQQTVRKLEQALEIAIAQAVVIHNNDWKYPLVPSKHTIQMMAKAATAVYEVAVENEKPADE